MEEMAELTKELCKFLFRGKDNYDHIAEEIADVEIMLGQLKHIFANHERVKVWEEIKLDRVEGKLNAGMVEEENKDKD